MDDGSPNGKAPVSVLSQPSSQLDKFRRAEFDTGNKHRPGRCVMVKALISLSGDGYQIRKGEEVILVNNEQEHIWQVQTAQGLRFVPSVVFEVLGPYEEGIYRADW